MVVEEVISKNPRQVSFVDHYYMINALATNRAEEPLDERILPRGSC